MIRILRGDITKEETEAIVNAANTGLRGGGGVDGAIHRAAGPSVMNECKKLGGCPTGEAVITRAGNLKVKYIIHTVGPVWHGGNQGEDGLLRNAYTNSFQLAQKYHLRSISFPAISTGVYGYPKDPAARIALKAGVEFEPDFEEIRYVCFSEEDLRIYSSVASEMNMNYQLK